MGFDAVAENRIQCIAPHAGVAMRTGHLADKCEVCIIGAGIAGLNALFVASQYLGRSDRIVLVDRRPRVGGMWVDTYDYVRLHQPHRLFTAGDIKWALNVKPSYLATKDEVLDHMQHCLDVIGKRVEIDEHYCWDYVSHEESSGSVRVTLRSPDGQDHVIEAKRLIKAFGFDVESLAPLKLSSTRIKSVTPNDMPAIRGSDAPVWIIGAGKTALDTAHTLITENRNREVNLVAGKGALALRRDILFPDGFRRWWSGMQYGTLAREFVRRYDGTNDEAVRDWFFATVGTGLTGRQCQFSNGFGGLVSDAEMSEIMAGLNRVEMDYFSDAVDGGLGPDPSTGIVFRSGRTLPLAAGSWIVNCTGLLLRTLHQYEPYVSAQRTTLSIQLRSATMPVTMQSAYFLTHLMFRGQLGSVPLYALDGEEGSRHLKPLYAALPLAVHNLSLLFDALPMKVVTKCGADLDNWYPASRRLATLPGFLRDHRREREHARQTLDTIRERFNLRGGPLISA